MTVEERFAELRDKWNYETSRLSVCRDEHWAYQAIIGLGSEVIPVLLREQRDRPGHWSAALMALTGICPAIPDEDRGRIARIAQHWVKWGRENGYDV